MAQKSLYLKNEQALTRALSRFVRRLPKEAGGLAIRKVAFDVIAEIQGGLTTGAGGNPKRVDTGRLRGAWTHAAKKAKIEGAASLAGTTPAGRDSGGRFLPGTGGSSDGKGKFTATADGSFVECSNAVPYAVPVEFGTVDMVAGNHVSRALAVVAQRVPGSVDPDSIRGRILAAWGRG